jgi:cytochrome c556
MNRSIVLTTVLLLAGEAAGIAASHIPTEKIVAQRQNSMKAMANAAKTIGGMFEGKLTYDGTAFKGAAETLRRLAGNALVAEFPQGSFGGTSAAKPDIDQSREEFAALARHLDRLASSLSKAADNAPNRITEAMRMAPGPATGGSLLGKRAGGSADADPSSMPAEHVFHLILQNCTSCHAKFRQKVQ